MKSDSLKKYTDIEAVDIIHQVANLYTSTKVPHDYGTGEIYTSTEVHMVKFIADNYGITVTEMAAAYGKTKGAISQILKKIESKGLIYREHDAVLEIRQHLYLTEKGSILDQAHRAYDKVNFGESMSKLRSLYDDGDINTAFTVLESWLDIRRYIQKQRLEKIKSQ